MPPLPPVLGTMAITTLFTIGSDANVSTRWFFKYSGGPPTPADCTNLAATALSAANANLPGALWSGNYVTGVKVYDLSSATASAGEALGTTAGSVGGTELPASTCALFNEVVARRYRGGKPRSYWPFGSSVNLATPQTWNAAAITNFTTVLTTYRSALLAMTHGTTTITGQVNISYYAGFTVVTDPITHRARNVPNLRATPLRDDITGIALNPRPGTQRRRIGA